MIITTEEEMRKIGRSIAAGLHGGEIVTLSGTLGAGKTFLAKSIISSLGFNGDVSSPTFAIIHEYDEPSMRLPIVHADLYRLDDPGELEELGLFDRPDSVVLVEWPEKGGTMLAEPDVAIRIEPLDDGTRRVEILEKRNGN